VIKLISLSFSGIGRFVEKQTIDFSTKEKILQIDGRNENTGGSSGSGKSTIFHALDYLLGINDIPATTLQSRLTKSTISVDGEFEIDGKKVKLSRSKKDGLSIEVDGEITSGNVKAADEQLENLIGIPRKIFKKMVHKKQKEGGFFLNLTAKESYDFLMKALGLESLTNKIALIDLDIKNNKEKLSVNEKYLAVLESGLESSRKDVESFALPESISPLFLEEIQSRLEAADAKIAFSQKEMISGLMEIDLESPTRPSIDTTDLTKLVSKLEQDKSTLEHERNTLTISLESNKNSLKHIAKQTEAEVGRIPYLRNQISKLASEIKSNMEQKAHIEKSQCPTCMQSWVGNSAQDKVNTINSTIEKLKKEAQEIVDLIQKEPELLNTLTRQTGEIVDIEHRIRDVQFNYSIRISDVVLELSNTKNKVTNIEKEVNDQYREKFNAFSEKRMSASIKYTNQISIDKDFRNSTKNEYDSAKNKKDLYDKSVQMRSVLDSKIVKQLADIDMVKKSTESTQKTVLIAEESKRLIKSYSLQKFQETLDAIGETASDILRNVPNMATASVYFEGCRETGSGTIKEEVTALINMDGEPDIDIKSLSGGERTAIDLAVDLAVIDVLEIKAGKGADFFILDEPFDSLDSYNKIEFLQLLTNSNLNKRIIIVDHSSEVKEVTNDSVIVHRNGEFSCIL
jgi:DNA repair exonuclease SbcCD ATPase subunit